MLYQMNKVIALIVTITLCLMVFLIGVPVALMAANRSIINKNLQSDSTYLVIKREYQSCIKDQYQEETHKCNDLEAKYKAERARLMEELKNE